MNGVRRIEDVLQGYRATGHFDPERWFTVCHQGEDGRLPDPDRLSGTRDLGTDLHGDLPAARGRGWGTGIVRYAQWLCWQAARKRLVLAVDAANEPALRMYAAAGFQAWDRPSVYVRFSTRIDVDRSASETRLAPD